MSGLLLTAGGVIALATTSAAAKTDSEILNELGLNGEWAVDCSKLPETASPHIVHSDADGHPVSTLVLGEGKTIVSAIRDVQIVEPDRIRWIETTPGGISFDVTGRLTRGRLRSLESVGSDGKIYVKNGFMSMVGKDTPWLTKCSTSTATPKDTK